MCEHDSIVSLGRRYVYNYSSVDINLDEYEIGNVSPIRFQKKTHLKKSADIINKGITSR